MMPKLAYKHYMLGLLTVVAVFNYLDRFVLSLLLEPIKQDLQLSDSQLGLFTGFAFFFPLPTCASKAWETTQGTRQRNAQTNVTCANKCARTLGTSVHISCTFSSTMLQ